MTYTDTLLQELRKRGFRLTKARKAIIEVLDHARKPLSVNELMERLGVRGVHPHKTSIYRELNFMTNEGIVIKITFGDKQGRFELAAMEHHHHAVCENCGEIEDVDCSRGIRELEKALHARKFKVNSHMVEFIGLCQKCQRRPERARPA